MARRWLPKIGPSPSRSIQRRTRGRGAERIRANEFVGCVVRFERSGRQAMGRPPGPLSRASGPRLRPRTDLPLPCPNLPKVFRRRIQGVAGRSLLRTSRPTPPEAAGRIIAHVHLTHRVMQFGPLQIPVAGLKWLAIAPECRGRGPGQPPVGRGGKAGPRGRRGRRPAANDDPVLLPPHGLALCGQACSSTAGRTRCWRDCWKKGCVIRVGMRIAACTFAHGVAGKKGRWCESIGRTCPACTARPTAPPPIGSGSSAGTPTTRFTSPWTGRTSGT